MTLFFAKLLGRIIAHSPECLLRLLAGFFGVLIYYGYASRRRSMLQSLACSFPEKDARWHRRIGRTSCVRLMETGLLSLAIPFLSEERILGLSKATPEVRSLFKSIEASPRPLMLGTMHLAYWEGLSWIKFLLKPDPSPEVITIYRPLRNPQMDDYVRSSRERFGIKLLSRKKGLHEALHALHRNACVSILYDQSAGSHGYLTLFLGRECSTTPLPGLLVEKSGASLGVIYARRTGFWHFDVIAEFVENDGTAKGVTLALNHKLETLLRTDETLCASWLWLHQRWRILDRPEEKQKLEAKRGGLIG